MHLDQFQILLIIQPNLTAISFLYYHRFSIFLDSEILHTLHTTHEATRTLVFRNRNFSIKPFQLDTLNFVFSFSEFLRSVCGYIYDIKQICIYILITTPIY